MGNKQDIHSAVRDRYAAIVRQAPLHEAAGSACCDPAAGSGADCCSPVQLYDGHTVADLPADITGLSLGCGDPVTIATLQPGETVLDLGSGAGMDCFLAARQVGESGHVIGVDMTPEMIARAEANRDKLGLTNVEFRPGQIEALPVADGEVDVILSNCVINLAPDKAIVFREAFRVLKPGGRIAISDIVTEGRFGPALQANMDGWAACVTGAIEATEYMALLREAGFEDVTVVDKATDAVVPDQDTGAVRVFSARITGRRPA